MHPGVISCRLDKRHIATIKSFARFSEFARRIIQDNIERLNGFHRAAVDVQVPRRDRACLNVATGNLLKHCVAPIACGFILRKAMKFSPPAFIAVWDSKPIRALAAIHFDNGISIHCFEWKLVRYYLWKLTSPLALAHIM